MGLNVGQTQGRSSQGVSCNLEQRRPGSLQKLTNQSRSQGGLTPAESQDCIAESGLPVSFSLTSGQAIRCRNRFPMAKVIMFSPFSIPFFVGFLLPAFIFKSLARQFLLREEPRSYVGEGALTSQHPPDRRGSGGGGRGLRSRSWTLGPKCRAAGPVPPQELCDSGRVLSLSIAK